MMSSCRIQLLTALLLGSVVTTGAQATSVAWEQIWFQNGVTLTEGESMEYTHDLTAGNPNVNGTPFDPNADCVLTADLWIKFYDDWSLQYLFTPEKVRVFLDGTLVETRTIPDNIFEIPYFGFQIEHFGVDIAFIQDDGKLDVKLKAKKGDFSVWYSKLHITHEPCEEEVPEPATLALVGAGALALARRRMRV